MKLTFGQFNDSYFPIMDGVGMTAHNYAYWLKKLGNRSLMVAPKVKGFKDHQDYKVYRFKSVLMPGMNPYRVGLPMIDVKFKKEMKKVKFDLVHAHCPFISGHLAKKIATHLDIPLVATFHTKYREDFFKVFNNEFLVDLMMGMTMDFYKGADLVWVPNKSTGNTLRDYGYEGEYEIMPNGSDLAIPDEESYYGFQKKGLDLIESDEMTFKFLFVGQHRWEKNVRLIIDSLKVLQEHGKDFLMVFVGEGYASKEMKQLVAQYGLAEKVRFMGLISDRDILRNIYAAANLFLFPSFYDNYPLVMQEAAALKVPTVVVEGSSCSEEIRDGLNGFLIENNVVSMVNKMELLMKSPEILRKAGEGARKLIYHPWENIVDDVLARYMELIHHRNPGKFNDINED